MRLAVAGPWLFSRLWLWSSVVHRVGSYEQKAISSITDVMRFSIKKNGEVPAFNAGFFVRAYSVAMKKDLPVLNKLEER